MKKQMFDTLLIKKDAVKKLLLLTVFCCLSYFINAQGSASIQKDSENIYSEYIAKNANSPLVKLYVNNPSNALAAQGMRITYILDHPEAQNLTASDIERMKGSLKDILKSVDSIEAMVVNGKSYKEAEALYNRQQQSKSAQDKNNTPANSSFEPSLSVPK
jgi:hypothetical protein